MNEGIWIGQWREDSVKGTSYHLSFSRAQQPKTGVGTNIYTCALQARSCLKPLYFASLKFMIEILRQANKLTPNDDPICMLYFKLYFKIK